MVTIFLIFILSSFEESSSCSLARNFAWCTWVTEFDSYVKKERKKLGASLIRSYDYNNLLYHFFFVLLGCVLNFELIELFLWPKSLEQNLCLNSMVVSSFTIRLLLGRKCRNYISDINV